MLTKTEWEQTQQRMTTAWTKGDLPGALREIDQVLADGTDEMKGQALVYRGMIRESRSDLSGAQQDWTSALAHGRKGSYTHYVAERSLGDASQKMGLRDEALRWYRAALNTCASGDEFSGGLALKAFLALAGAQLAPEDRALVDRVAKKSWGVMELPGEADLKDLPRTAEALAARAKQP